MQYRKNSERLVGGHLYWGEFKIRIDEAFAAEARVPLLFFMKIILARILARLAGHFGWNNEAMTFLSAKRGVSTNNIA